MLSFFHYYRKTQQNKTNRFVPYVRLSWPFTKAGLQARSSVPPSSTHSQPNSFIGAELSCGCRIRALEKNSLKTWLYFHRIFVSPVFVSSWKCLLLLRVERSSLCCYAAGSAPWVPHPSGMGTVSLVSWHQRNVSERSDNTERWICHVKVESY